LFDLLVVSCNAWLCCCCFLVKVQLLEECSGACTMSRFQWPCGHECEALLVRTRVGSVLMGCMTQCLTHLAVQLGHLILLLTVGGYALRPPRRAGTFKGNCNLASRQAVRWQMQRAMHVCSKPGSRRSLLVKNIQRSIRPQQRRSTRSEATQLYRARIWGHGLPLRLVNCVTIQPELRSLLYSAFPA
jgi:hypothetical protein